MTARSVSFVVCGGLACLAGLYRIRDLRRKRDDYAHWALQVATFAGGTAFLIATEEFYVWFDRLVGVPNLIALLTYSLIMVFSAAIVTMLLLWSHPPDQAWASIRFRLAFYGFALAAMITLFALSSVPEERPADFDAHYGPDPVVGTFLIIYFLAFAYSLISMARIAWRFAPISGSHWRRRSLRGTAIAACLPLAGYCGGKTVYVVASWLGMNPPRSINEIGVGIASLGSLIMATSLTLPAFAPRLVAGWHWFGSWRSYHAIYPLWRIITTAVPHVVLDPPRSRAADLLNGRDLNYRLYRRYVEIRDGQLALRPRMDGRADAAVEEYARGRNMTDEQIRALTEAARITSAVSSGDSPSNNAVGAGLTTGGEDVRSEVRWLAQVAKALPHAPMPAVAVPASTTDPRET